MFCPNCGSENSNERRFCFNCGRAFVSASVEIADAASAAVDGNEFINSLSGRNEFLDSLSGRNEFLDSLSGRTEFRDSMSGFRIDAAKTEDEMIFVPSGEDEAELPAANDQIFPDAEADDEFELSLSGMKIDEIPKDEEQPEREPEPIQPAEVAETELQETPVRVETEVAIPSRRRFSIFRPLAILVFGLAAFAAGSAATMFVFQLPPEVPSIIDLPVVAATISGILPPPEMVLVPGGEFLMGSDEGDPFSRPQHPVTVAPFFIDRTEVTNEEYYKFVKASGHQPPLTWQDGRYPVGEERFPVTGVTWYDAAEYAAWRGKRLPTEAEWEFAARGHDGRVYPWGSEWDASLANADGGSKSAREVGHGGRSPFGLHDMAGNVWEWTSSDAKGFSGGKQIPWSRHRLKIIRGGNWQSDQRTASTFFRGFYGASGEKDYKGTGFRCVKDIPTER